MASGKTGKFELTGSGGITLRLSYTEDADIAANASTLRITALEVKSASYYGVTYYLDGTVYIGNTAAITMRQGVTGNNVYLPALNTYASVGGPLGKATVPHADDGSGTVRIAVQLRGFTASGGGGSGWSVSGSFDLPLTPIPRATLPELSSPAVILGNGVRIRTPAALDRFTHTLRFSFGEAEGLIGEGVTDEVTWTPPVDLAFRIPDAVSGSAEILCTTFDGSREVGTTRTSLELIVPETVVPAITGFRAERVDNSVPDSWGIYVAGISQARLFSSAEGAYGASVTEYRVGSGLSGADVLTPPLRAGQNLFELTVTDSRGRTAKRSLTLLALAYDVPAFARVPELYRCDESGEPDETGNCLFARVEGRFSSLDGRNSLTTLVSCAGQTAAAEPGRGQVLFAGLLDAAATIPVTVSVTDALGNSDTYQAVLPTASAALHIRPGGRGAAFGKFAEADGVLQVAWDLDVQGAITQNGQPIGGVSREALLELIYPVGSVYMSANDVSPQIFLGGTWERIRDTFLLAAGTEFAPGSTGGEKTHILTIEEMPAHSHEIRHRGFYGTAAGSGRNCITRTPIAADPNDTIADCSEVGGGIAHNNMPPYLALFMWQRTA